MISTYLSELEKFLTSNEDVDELKFNHLLNKLHPFRSQQEYKKGMKSLRASFDELSTNRTMQGRAFLKEHGYAGDYEIIDRIYTEHKAENPQYRKWDTFFHQQPAPKAVRNRKAYFLEKFDSKHIKREIKVLNLASGSCRDVYELLETNPNASYSFDCVELDKNAISFAKNLLKDHLNKVSFINQNIFKFALNNEYDIIWSAGLFDYFDDLTFERILRSLIQSNPRAAIIIGNFSDLNPTAPYMELIGEWFLNYRSEETLNQIALKAGASQNDIVIEKEPEGVNLFLTINLK